MPTVLAVADSALYPANTDLFQKRRQISKQGPDNVTVVKRTVFPVFISRWKGNADAKVGSVMAAVIFESVDFGYPGRLMGTIPLRLCAEGMY